MWNNEEIYRLWLGFFIEFVLDIFKSFKSLNLFVVF